MHLSTQFLLSLSYALEKSRNTGDPGSQQLLRKFQEVTFFQVGKDIVPYPAVREEGSLGGIHDRGERCTPPVCQCFTKELDVGMEKGIRAVRGRVRAWAGATYNRTMVPRNWVGVRDPAAESKASVNIARRGGPSRGQKAWYLVWQAVTARVVYRGEAYRGLVKAPAR